MPCCCCCCYNLLRRSSSSNNHSNNKKQHSSSMRIAPKRVDCISVIYNTFIYAYMPHTYPTVKLTLQKYRKQFCWRFFISGVWNVKNPAGNYILKLNNKSTRTRCEICSKLTIKTLERRRWRRSDVFIVNFEQISPSVVVFYC